MSLHMMLKELFFVTGNIEKFNYGFMVMEEYNVKLVQASVDIDEIQGENLDLIAQDKAAKAYAQLQQPLVVSDDAWSFEGLNGFPGPYMHSVNEWFSPQDFLNLTQALKNRRVILSQRVVYTDSATTKMFKVNTKGKLLKHAKGVSSHPSHCVITLEGSGGKSIAEVVSDKTATKSSASRQVWHKCASWLTQTK